MATRDSQIVVEVLETATSNVILSQIVVEVLISRAPDTTTVYWVDDADES